MQYSFEGVAEYHGGVCLKRLVQASLALLLLFGALTTLVVMAANLVLPVLADVCDNNTAKGQSCWWASRTTVILFNVVFIFPWCLKENLHALRHSSQLALACLVYLFLAVLVRCGQKLSTQYPQVKKNYINKNTKYHDKSHFAFMFCGVLI